MLILLTACAQSGSERYNWDEAKLLRQGDSITALAFDTLRNALLQRIGAEGYEGAIAFCQLAATGITAYYDDSSWTIRRVTGKPRNHFNMADSADLVVLHEYEEQLQQGDSLQPILVPYAAKAVYYKPIRIMPMCLGCHGTPLHDIAPEVLATLNNLYPEDKATGYKAGDLRGMWKVIF